MSGYLRYAIYWLPDGALKSWGESWLGWSLSAGAPLPRPDVPGLPRPIEDITRAATVYGLHATIKPPFRLAAGRTEPELAQALADFCTRQAPILTGGLTLTDLDGFLALTPQGDTGVLDAMAFACVRALDAFRAAAPPDETARRRAAGLTARQEQNLQDWGYPYVDRDFRLHVTLTGRLPDAERPLVRDIIGPAVAPHLPRPLRLTGLSLVGQTAAGFREIGHHAFAG